MPGIGNVAIRQEWTRRRPLASSPSPALVTLAGPELCRVQTFRGGPGSGFKIPRLIALQFGSDCSAVRRCAVSRLAGTPQISDRRVSPIVVPCDLAQLIICRPVLGLVT